ncbi:MAG: hypothetical protein ACTSPM_09240 [Candidatus Heimdallarchaeota archaeon]
MTSGPSLQYSQYVTKTVYTVERLTEWSKKIEENIRNAKYNF